MLRVGVGILWRRLLVGKLDIPTQKQKLKRLLVPATLLAMGGSPRGIADAQKD